VNLSIHRILRPTWVCSRLPSFLILLTLTAQERDWTLPLDARKHVSSVMRSSQTLNTVLLHFGKWWGQTSTELHALVQTHQSPMTTAPIHQWVAARCILTPTGFRCDDGIARRPTLAYTSSSSSGAPAALRAARAAGHPRTVHSVQDPQ